MKLQIDHLVISVKDLKKSVKFYEAFLGKALVSKWDASWQLGQTKLFLTDPYKKNAKSFNKNNIGLNHFAFIAKTLNELKALEERLNKSKIKHSGIQVDKYSGNKFIWFDDLDKIRLEFYLRLK